MKYKFKKTQDELIFSFWDDVPEAVDEYLTDLGLEYVEVRNVYVMENTMVNVPKTYTAMEWLKNYGN